MLHPCDFQKWIKDCVKKAKEQGMSDQEIQFGIIRVLNEMSTNNITMQPLGKEKS